MVKESLIPRRTLPTRQNTIAPLPSKTHTLGRNVGWGWKLLLNPANSFTIALHQRFQGTHSHSFTWADMTIEFQTELHAWYVQLSCTGTYSMDALLNVFREAFRIGADAGMRAALVDARKLTGSPDALERYEIGVTAAKLQSELNECIVLAVVGVEPLVDPNRLGETVAVNRGMAGKVFEDIDDALDWLEQTLG